MHRTGIEMLYMRNCDDETVFCHETMILLLIVIKTVPLNFIELYRMRHSFPQKKPFDKLKII